MKRADMSPGLAVELQRGRDFPTFTTNVVLLDDRIWYLYAPFGTWDGERVATRSGGDVRLNGRELDKGYPVAIRRPIYQRDDQGRHVWLDEDHDTEPVLLGYEWVPGFVPANQIVPVGTAAEYHERRDAEEREQSARYQRHRDTEGQLAARSCCSVRLSRSGYSVDIPTKDLVRLLDERDRLRAAVDAAIKFNEDRIDPVVLDGILRGGLASE